jgi:carboxylesterase type B
MFLELIAALKWVQTNIAAFGTPTTSIFESGGGGRRTPSSRHDLFHRAIYESGANVRRPGGRHRLLPRLKQSA